jgi:FAD binding domain
MAPARIPPDQVTDSVGKAVRRMASEQPEHTLRVAVIGASLAGLFAAAAVSRAGHEAVLIERDRLGDTAAPRAGVSQGEQPHVFLLRGLLAAEELLPGLRADLESRGAVPFDSARVAWLGEHGWLKRAEGFEVLSLTRPLFEQVVRERVLGLDRVELRDDTPVKGLHPSDSTGRRRWRVETARPDDNVDADLVIDASGRNSRLPERLAALGATAPKSSEIDARTGYSTRVYRRCPCAAWHFGDRAANHPALRHRWTGISGGGREVAGGGVRPRRSTAPSRHRGVRVIPAPVVGPRGRGSH